jgi:hypothetical protein
MYRARDWMILFGLSSLSRRIAWSAHQESAIQIKFTIILISESDPTTEDIIIDP